MNVEFQVFFSVAIEMHRMGDVEIISKPCKAIDPGNVHGFGKRSRQEPSTPMSPSISVWRVCIWLFIIRIDLYRFRLKQLLQLRSQDVNTDQSFATERCSDFAVPISACFWDKTWISLFPDMKEKHGVWCVWCLSESIYFLPFLESFPCWDSINKEFRIQQSLFHLWTLGNLHILGAGVEVSTVAEAFNLDPEVVEEVNRVQAPGVWSLGLALWLLAIPSFCRFSVSIKERMERFKDKFEKPIKILIRDLSCLSLKLLDAEHFHPFPLIKLANHTGQGAQLVWLGWGRLWSLISCGMI